MDPELLGKVFENLLAAYNPETGKTARRETGSYYTPRAIVDYMVEEALVAALVEQVSPTDGDAKFWDERCTICSIMHKRSTTQANGLMMMRQTELCGQFRN